MERKNEFDYAKAIGIMCVVVGHMTTYPRLIRSAIYSFHMPLFFIISGNQAYTSAYKKCVIEGLVKSYNPSIHFDPAIGISEMEYRASGFDNDFNEYNSEYNNLAQSPNLKAKTAMLIGVIGDNNAMGEAARDNDKKTYIDKEGEKLMRTTEAFANVGRLGELTSLVGEDTNMTDEQLKEFAAMNSEEIKDENGNGTGKFKSSLPIVDSNGELITNTKEGCEKLRERLKKDQNKAKKFIKEYAKTLEEVDSTTGYQLNREQLAMLTWMRMKSVLGEERQDDMTKDKLSLIKKLYEAYKRNKTYTDKNDDDYDKNLEKESEYLRQLLEKYKDVKDEDLINEERESRNIFTSELRRINRAKEVLRKEKGKLQREKKNRENTVVKCVNIL